MAPPREEAPPADHFFYYFAYGSNLLDERLHVQVKGAIFENVGVLRGYRLDFFDDSSLWHGAVASIETSDAADEVWGCVWRVPRGFADELDRQEQRYHRIQVRVENGSGSFVCVTYQLSNPQKVSRPPSPHYKHVIVSGAVKHALPEHYLRKLRAIVDNGSTAEVSLGLKVLDELQLQLQLPRAEN